MNKTIGYWKSNNLVQVNADVPKLKNQWSKLDRVVNNHRCSGRARYLVVPVHGTSSAIFFFLVWSTLQPVQPSRACHNWQQSCCLTLKPVQWPFAKLTLPALLTLVSTKFTRTQQQTANIADQSTQSAPCLPPASNSKSACLCNFLTWHPFLSGHNHAGDDRSEGWC